MKIICVIILHVSFLVPQLAVSLCCYGWSESTHGWQNFPIEGCKRLNIVTLSELPVFYL